MNENEHCSLSKSRDFNLDPLNVTAIVVKFTVHYAVNPIKCDTLLFSKCLAAWHVDSQQALTLLFHALLEVKYN